MEKGMVTSPVTERHCNGLELEMDPSRLLLMFKFKVNPIVKTTKWEK